MNETHHTDQSPATTAVHSPALTPEHSKVPKQSTSTSTPGASSNVFVITLCLFQSFAGLLFGWEQGVISGVILLPDYVRRFGTPNNGAEFGYYIQTQRQSLITSIMALGCLFGALSAGRLSEWIGKKKGNLIALTVFIAGISIEISSSRQWVQIIFGRIIAGFGIGAMSMITPLYQAEASPPHLRGFLTGTYQLAVTLGIFLANCTNDGMRKYSGSISWRLPIGIQLLWALLLFAGTTLTPESPRFFLGKHFSQGGSSGVDYKQRALSALARLRGRSETDSVLLQEFNEIYGNMEAEQQLGSSSFWECFQNKDRMLLRTCVGIGMQSGQQWTGCNFFFSYGVKFFQSSGINDSYTIQIILSAVNVICTFPGLLAVERRGRRETLLFGSTVMAISLIITGAVSTAMPGQKISGQVLIAFSCVFIGAFASTWGPLAWVVASESFPMRLAPKCVSIATACNWFWNFVLAIVTPYLTDDGYGNLQSKITFLWAGAVVAFGIFVWFCVPETKGLSLVQVDELYLAHIPAWKSASWVPFGDESTRNTRQINEQKAGDIKHLDNHKEV